jgi:hypothetical protein
MSEKKATNPAAEWEAAANDARLFGNGFVLVRPDGVERIDPAQVTIKPPATPAVPPANGQGFTDGSEGINQMGEQTTPEPTRLAQLLETERHLINAIRTGELLPDRTWRVAIAGIQKRIEREMADCREAGIPSDFTPS